MGLAFLTDGCASPGGLARFEPWARRFTGVAGDGATGAITAAGRGTGRTTGELGIMAPIMENTTPPNMKATKSLRPFPVTDCGGALAGFAALWAMGLLTPEYWRL